MYFFQLDQSVSMRSFFKEDDGLFDIIVKLVTVAAFFVALHQYFYKVYPVWDKENQLSELTKSYEETETKLSNVNNSLQVATDNLADKEQEVREVKNTLALLKTELSTERQKFDKAVSKLLAEAEKKQLEFTLEKERIQNELLLANANIHDKNSRVVDAYLEVYAKEVFNIQLDNIRWSRKAPLDLKRDIIKFSDDKLVSEEDPIKIVALEVFKLFAQKKLSAGEQEYSQALMVGAFYQFDAQAQKLIAGIENT